MTKDLQDQSEAGRSLISGTPLPVPSSSEKPATPGRLTSTILPSAAQLHAQLTHHLSDGAKIFLAGATAGIISRTVTAPVDRLKTLMMVHEGQKPMTFQEGLRTMGREGSIKSFFRGNLTNCVKVAPETAIKLTINEEIRHLIESFWNDHDDAPHPDSPDRVRSNATASTSTGANAQSIPFSARVVVGGLSGAVAQTIIYPLEVVKTRLAVAPPRTYHGILDCLVKTAAKEGFPSLYRGMVPSLIGILPYAGIDIAIFSELKERLEIHFRSKENIPGWAILGAGVTSSILAQIVSYPLAVIRTRMQAQGIKDLIKASTSGAVIPDPAVVSPIPATKQDGAMVMVSKMFRKHGLAGFYRGLIPNIFKLAPAAGISWYTYERVKQELAVGI